ncbi:MAG: hypothetical protein N2490_06540 [Ignavibacteria bacterium]|nr:hypothetical protein [Ignavibacteria bacterium]
MIAVIIFYLHAIFAVFVFAKSFQSDGLIQAFLNVVFIIILFTVGWTLTDVIIGLFISDKGYIITIKYKSLLDELLRLTGFYKPLGDNKVLLTPKDTVSLVVLTIIEVFFYRFFYSLGKRKEESLSYPN